MAGHDNPQVSSVYDVPFGTPSCCVACERPVDPTVGYPALWAGTTRQPDLIAAAHANLWEGPSKDDIRPWCEDALRSRWLELLDAAGAGVLVEGDDVDGRRFFLRGDGLHAGAPMELLTADGVWLSGTFEYHLRPRLPPRFHFALGGWDCPVVAITVPTDTVVRVPRQSR